MKLDIVWILLDVLYKLIISCFVVYFIAIGTNYAIWRQSIAAYRYVPGNEKEGLPAYNGSCSDMVRVSYQALQESREFAGIIFKTQAESAVAFNYIFRGTLFQAASLAEFCDDIEAQGIFIYVAINIDLDGITSKNLPPKIGLGLSKLRFKQAEKIGYNKKHPTQATFVEGRLDRTELLIKEGYLK